LINSGPSSVLEGAHPLQQRIDTKDRTDHQYDRPNEPSAGRARW
jgi:hypothetical protein